MPNVEQSSKIYRGEVAWEDQVAGIPRSLELPLDFPRPHRRRFDPLVAKVPVPKGLEEGLRRLTPGGEAE